MYVKWASYLSHPLKLRELDLCSGVLCASPSLKVTLDFHDESLTSLLFYFSISKAGHDMIVNHADGLHEGVANRRADK